MKIRISSTKPENLDNLLVILDPIAWDKHQDDIAQTTGIDLATLSRDFKADNKESLPLFVNLFTKKITLLGLGKKHTIADVCTLVRRFVHQNRNKLPKNVAIDLETWGTFSENNFSENVEACVSGIYLGFYEIGKYKTEKGKPKKYKLPDTKFTLLVSADKQKQAEKAQERGKILAETQIKIMDWVNKPSHEVTALSFAKDIEESGEKYNYSVKVLHKKEIQKEGLHALLAVNQGSEIPPTFTIMEYKPKDAIATVGLVGKGLMFDTGGLNIKVQAMVNMKCDMAGGATVAAIVEAAARLELPIAVIGIVPATDSLVDSRSFRPSDIIGSYSGLSIEIIDTDAEGRLILADGLSYMKRNYNPDVMIDMATLTGSVIGTLGFKAAGYVTHNDTLAQELYDAGQETKEKVWRLPLWEDYDSEVKSEIADLKNHHSSPYAGAIVAGKFLEAFVENHEAWAHIDVAGTTFLDSEFAKGKSATGYGLRLIIKYLENKIAEKK